MTESAGAASRTVGPEECSKASSVGRLSENMEAKIVDPSSGEALPPGHKGELWIRGPGIMKGLQYSLLYVFSSVLHYEDEI